MSSGYLFETCNVDGQKACQGGMMFFLSALFSFFLLFLELLRAQRGRVRLFQTVRVSF